MKREVDPMNRIERLLWEEAQIKEIERAGHGERGVKATKVVWTMVFAAMVAFLATRPWPMSAAEANAGAVVASRTAVQGTPSKPALRGDRTAQISVRESVAATTVAR